MHRGMQATLQHQHLRKKEKCIHCSYLLEEKHSATSEAFTSCVLWAIATHRVLQKDLGAFTFQTLTRKSTIAPLNPYHAISLLIRSSVCYEVCVCVCVCAYIDDPVCCSRWGQCHILVVSLQGVGRGSADIMLPKQQRERNRERWGIERVFFDSLLAYATWALRDNLQCDTPCSSVLAYSNRY